MSSPEKPQTDASDKPKKQGLLSLLGLIKKEAAPEVSEQPLSAEELKASSSLIDHARAFQALRVSDVMTPRVDVVAIELSLSLAEIVAICVESEHSRLPIYRETLDDPVGVVHIKDILKILAPNDSGAVPNWQEPILHRLRREILYVPASMKASELLLRMQAQRIHIALVIDEFGGTDGLVTLEDLIEAVVGNIDDEYDTDLDEPILERSDGLIEVDGRAEIGEVEAYLGLSLTPEDIEEEVDTIAGLVATLAGRVPQRGEVVRYEAGKLDFEVMDADARRIKRLRLRRPVLSSAVKA